MTDSSIRSLTPLIHVASVPRSAAFYEQLGFEVKDSFTPPGSEEPSWASLWCGDGELMIANGSGGGAEASEAKPVMLYVYCSDVEAKHAQLSQAGMNVGEVTKPFYNPNGEFSVRDPDGYSISFA